MEYGTIWYQTNPPLIFSSIYRHHWNTLWQDLNNASLEDSAASKRDVGLAAKPLFAGSA